VTMGRRTRGAVVALVTAPLVLVCAAATHGRPWGAVGVAARLAPIFAPRLFATSDACLACHNDLATASGEDVSIGTAWRATMMANSARDPYWQASVRREVLDHPAHRRDIENECATCHMPMLRAQARVEGRDAAVLARLPLGGADDDDRLAADGVSCTVCHQIGAERLGDPAGFNGRFAVDTTTPFGARAVFGPHEVDRGRTRIMRSASEFVPTQGAHVRSSELCATCHTLYTQALDSGGSVVGRLPEQVPYLEWRHSAYARGDGARSCQGCHMPAVAESTAISGVWGRKRGGLARHEFLGGNFFVLRMLNRYRAELGVAAPARELEAAARRTVEHLASDAARVGIDSLRVAGGYLVADVVVRNLTGHKLPTAYPSRRAWLHVTVRDGTGAVVFESGRVDPGGAIAGNDNDADPAAFEPHRREITRADEVQVYESVLVDARGAVTTGLLSAVRYAKDNRVLPAGFDKRTAAADVAVRGDAAADPDFAAGADRVRYAVAVPPGAGPFHVEAALLYQPIGFRWARNLDDGGRDGAAEIARFRTYYDATARSSWTTLARDSATTR
jgi:hypothetical protein